MRVALAVVALVGAAGCDVAFGLERPSGWIDGYTFRKQIAITPNRTFDLMDVPISVAIPADPDLMANARADGRDLVFGDLAGKILGSEIVGYDPATGELEAWVRVPAVPGQGVTTVALYYGGPSVLAASGAAWPATCAGAWHMYEASTTEHDSTSNAHDATGTSAPARLAGIVGSARDLGQTSPLSIAAAGLDFGTASFGVSMWVRVDETLGVSDSPLYKGGSAPNNAGYGMLLGNGGWVASVSDGAGTEEDVELTGSPTIDRWTQLGVIVDQQAKTARTFVDGAEVMSVDLGAGFGSTTNTLRRLELGAGMYPYQGGIDELRIYSAAPPEGWFALEYENLTDRARFLQLGDQQTQ